MTVFALGLWEALISAVPPSPADLDLPGIPPLSSDTGVIAVADYVRVGMFAVGLCVAGLSVRHMVELAGRYDHRFVAGFRWRTAALLVGVVYVCVAAYDRIGDPVTVQLVIALMYLLFALYATHLAATLPRPPVAGEQRLEELLEARRRDGDGR